MNKQKLNYLIYRKKHLQYGGYEMSDLLTKFNNVFADKPLKFNQETKIYDNDDKKTDGISLFIINGYDEITYSSVNVIKKKILKSNKMEGKKIIQIIGDSNPFPTQKVQKIIEKIKFIINQHTPFIIEYGFTGKKNDEGSDINQIVSLLIDENNYDSIGNLVDKSIGYLSPPTTISQKTQIFTIVTNQPPNNKWSTGSIFGDDVKLTDNLCDVLICCDGGPQSFTQFVNCLHINKIRREKNYIKNGETKSIFGTYLENIFEMFNSLEKVNEEKMIDIYGIYGYRENKDEIAIFSTVEFLNRFISNRNQIDKDTANTIKDNYFKDHMLFAIRNKDGKIKTELELTYGDKKNIDTKRQKFNDDWNKFIDNKLWEELPDQFHKCD